MTGVWLAKLKIARLAATYAASHQYDRAVTTGKKALSIAEAAGDDASANRIRYFLEFYSQGKPYRQDQKTEEKT